MPSQWTSDLAASFDSPIEALREIRRSARTSTQAATLKLIQCLPPNFVVVRLSYGEVKSADKSPGTKANLPPRGQALAPDPYPYATATWRFATYQWWFLGANKFPVPQDASQKWRTVLNQIVDDLDLEVEEAKKFKARVNAIVAAVNGGPGRPKSAIEIFNAAVQRLYANREYNPPLARFVKHALRDEYLALRIAEFLKKQS